MSRKDLHTLSGDEVQQQCACSHTRFGNRLLQGGQDLIAVNGVRKILIDRVRIITSLGDDVASR